jgi:ribosomal protein L12E/L44/L45/RPP1/RPP2
LISIKGHASLLWGKDSEEAIAAYKKTGAPAAATTLQVPEPDAEAAEEVEAEEEEAK